MAPLIVALLTVAGMPGVPTTDTAPVSVPAVADPDPHDVRPDVAGEATATPVPEPWRTLAACESGDWEDGGASFVEGSARWDWGAPGMQLPPWGTDLHHGGLQHAPETWDWVAPDVLGDGAPGHAYDATPAEQVAVAQEVQARQGWEAWPVCSELVGLR